MNISPNVARSIYILLILALAKETTTVSSQIISQLIEESDSSTKKLLTKLARSNLVKAKEGKEGGYLLAKDISEIHLLDAWQAVETPMFRQSRLDLASRIFTLKEQAKQSENLVEQYLEKAQTAFQKELAGLTLQQLLVSDFRERALDWKSILEERKHG